MEVVPDDNDQDSPPKGEKSPEPGGGQSSESLSIEETNKLRAKLGLKPLDVQSNDNSKSAGSSNGKIKDDLGEFYHKPADHLGAKAEQEKLRQKLADHKEKRKLESKLSKVKSLGDSDSDDDVQKWVDRNRHLVDQKKEAEKRVRICVCKIFVHHATYSV